MKQYAEHDRVGICHALRRDEIYKRVFSGGYPYINNGLILRSSSLKPIYSYGKNYEKFDVKFALFVWTTEDSQQKIEELFESVLENVAEEHVAQVTDNSSFAYID